MITQAQAKGRLSMHDNVITSLIYLHIFVFLTMKNDTIAILLLFSSSLRSTLSESKSFQRRVRGNDLDGWYYGVSS